MSSTNTPMIWGRSSTTARSGVTTLSGRVPRPDRPGRDPAGGNRRKSLWDTFPLGGDVTSGLRSIAGSPPFGSEKVVAAREACSSAGDITTSPVATRAPAARSPFRSTTSNGTPACSTASEPATSSTPGSASPTHRRARPSRGKSPNAGLSTSAIPVSRIRHVGNPYGAENMLR